MPHEVPKKRRRGLKIALAIVGGVVVLSAVGGAVTLHHFGKDDPSQYAERVAAIEHRFSTGYPRGEVLLTGSSFFELWATSEADLNPLSTINIGIGGTKVGDHLAYFDEMVTPFAPRALVVYIGSNDMGAIPFYTKSAADTVALIEQYLDMVRDRLPDTRIYYVAITEAPARDIVRSDIQEANRSLSLLAETRGDFTFIDTAPALLNPDGTMNESLFGADRLHFNEAGYRVFAEAVRQGLCAEYVEGCSE